ncbi:hypothetical protein GGE12_006302 [Rhizobium mongolense]|uniref:Uncharacterized protein n=1 Tax=Rhizobium mongolense TaxID=57676 RepID=A0A7W6RUS7_9HYPH|nr:hypothetical protein [Rhizobium mongolense]
MTSRWRTDAAHSNAVSKKATLEMTFYTVSTPTPKRSLHYTAKSNSREMTGEFHKIDYAMFGCVAAF